jgi:small-conductance mechanosensitive channel
MKMDYYLAVMAPEFILTVAVVASVILVNIAISAILRGRVALSRETKLRASVFWRNFSFLIALVVLITIWRAELRAAALSLAALSVALVIAGKELVTSVLGYVYRTTSSSFEFGDVIEINGVKGEVIDQTLLSTTVLEMNDENLFTGRVTQFPNSFFITHPMRNFSHLGDYQLALVAIPLAPDQDFDQAKRLLAEVASAVCAEFVAPTQEALRELEGEQFILLPSAEPRVSVRIGEGGQPDLLLRFPCASNQRTRTEQELLTRYLAAIRPVATT